MKHYARIMENPLVYRMWMAPFADRKMMPLFAHNDISRARRVLDVGCGPGTNTHHFRGAEYLGIDVNPAYIASARRRHGRDFVVADVTTYQAPRDRRFDFIMANSLLHHIDDEGTRRVLHSLPPLLDDDGYVHILDLVMPDRPSIATFLARADRGDYPRPLDAWWTLFTEVFEPVIFEPYPLGAAGMTLWSFVYFKGRARA